MRIRVGAVANRGGARKGSVGSEVRNRDSSSYYGCVILFVGGPISQANGWVAQLAEQRTENPRVGGSIPPPATSPLRNAPFSPRKSRGSENRESERKGRFR